MPSLIENIGSIISGIVGSILAVFQTIFNAIWGVISTALAAVGTTITGLAQTFEGLLKFLLSNIVVIGAVVGGIFLYTVYQQRNGRSVTAAPAKNKKSI